MGRDGSQPAARCVLSLIAAVVLFAGACRAPTVGEGQARTTPTSAEEETGRSPSPGVGEASPPNRRPDLTGTITKVKRRDQGTNPSEWILVEEDPDVEFSAGPNTEGWGKLFFEITDNTRIFVRRGGDGGEVVAATAADLAKGQTVDAWHGNHDVAESYPGQTVASEVVIHPPPHRRGPPCPCRRSLPPPRT